MNRKRQLERSFSSENREKATKRAVQRFSVHSINAMEKELQCPICFQLMEDPYATVCAHSFCLKCLRQSLKYKPTCPKCNYALEKEQIFPNFALANLALKCREIKAEMKKFGFELPSSTNGGANDSLLHCLSDSNFDLPAVDQMIKILSDKRAALQEELKMTQYRLLKEFLTEMIFKRKQQLLKSSSELKVLENDLKQTEASMFLSSIEPSVVPSTSQSVRKFKESPALSSSSSSSSTVSKIGSLVVEYPSSSSGSSLSSTPPNDASALMNKRTRMRLYFDDLEQHYLSSRNPAKFELDESAEGYDKFMNSLSKITQYSGFRCLGSLNYNVDVHSGLSIVSSIEFDRDGELFTIAGVTKKIKLYEYNTILEDTIDIHYPISEMQCNSKISCVSWNPYNRSLLASSDYEGIVQLWDVYSATSVKKFQEHERRCWSVCFNNVDPHLMASGSDDAKVKIWSINCKDSVRTIEAKVNVCCVYFNPESRFHLAFGSADHCVHYYDLRNPTQPTTVFRGHKKAVSYVKFTSAGEIVSASTDSQLRSWSTGKGNCTRVYKGHQNEKNFVGLDTDGNYIACGSENNVLFVYYKELSKPFMTYAFDGEPSLLNTDRIDPDSNDFVSAVCWKKDSNVILAANSQGVIKVLELI